MINLGNNFSSMKCVSFRELTRHTCLISDRKPALNKVGNSSFQQPNESDNPETDLAPPLPNVARNSSGKSKRDDFPTLPPNKSILNDSSTKPIDFESEKNRENNNDSLKQNDKPRSKDYDTFSTNSSDGESGSYFCVLFMLIESNSIIMNIAG